MVDLGIDNEQVMFLELAKQCGADWDIHRL